MKRLLLLSFLLLTGFVCLSAQNVVSGTVVDRDGNPIPGAKVEIPGSTESTLTELDGTFRLETAHPARTVRVYYVGMVSKTQKVTPDMLIRLSQENWWNREPQKAEWLIAVQGAFPGEGIDNPAFGLMLGKVKRLGWYVKGVYSSSKSTVCDYPNYPAESDLINYWTTGKDKRGFYAATAGVIARLNCPVHFYAGVGYANRKVAWELADGSYAKQPENSYSGVAIDYGLMLKINRFFINGGTIMSLADGCNFTGNVGIGFSF